MTQCSAERCNDLEYIFQTDHSDISQRATCYDALSVHGTSLAAEYCQSIRPDDTQARLCKLPGSREPTTTHHSISSSQSSCPPRCTMSPCYSTPFSSSIAVTSPEPIASPSHFSSLPSGPQTSCDLCGELFGHVEYFFSHLVSYHNISKPFHCGRGTCKTQRDERSFKRHLTNTHFGTVYRCCCGYSSRKDKHYKHLEKYTCNGSSFQCICGHAEYDKCAHKAHIHKCGRRKKGRPNKQKTK
ncbi:uncharacterized protein B0J16DRAFT_340004 [Fusarium flagelliforme]|uniref:uncharacterized protein n=1 Tax=Fusarium flagelliforme TaxID=2675880 RepID=UPI001E8EA25E|nr:uncharacterized protein B0J16DRAFT_340004 [Fusarium flagelliforme]KAH7189654.1 hypothetical protein B0J16DRAFT_340004 [Fusarium flagelliforme]